MKIVYIITGLNTGGAERALYNLLQGGFSDQFDCHVISLSSAGTMGRKIERLGVPVTALNFRMGFTLLAGFLTLSRTIKSLQPDLIQGWMYHGNLVATLVRFLFARKAKLAWNIRHSLSEISYEKFTTRQIIRANRFFSSSADLLLYNSQLSRQQHQAFAFKKDKSQVIANGINVQQFCFSQQNRETIRRELSIPAKALVVGHVARFHPMKDHGNFLQAAEQIIQHYPETHFILSGAAVGRNNRDLTVAISPSLQTNIHFLDERSDVPALMSCMDVFCLCSAWGEAFPNVLGEAMAVGIPCVATDVGDSALIVNDCGVIVPIKNSLALAKGIQSLLSLTAIERSQLGVKARQHIVDKFSLDMIVKKYSALYKKLVG